MKQTNTELNVSANSTGRPAPIQNEGIYLIYADDRSEPYTGANAKKDVTYIGVVFQGHRFAVSLTESKARLLKDYRDATKRNDYKKRECDALYDFDSFGNTEKLIADNNALADLLKEGEAIPALGVLVIICHLGSRINEALAYVGGELLSSVYYWSSTEGIEHGAWSVLFGSGDVYPNYKCNSNAVRAVAAF